MVFCPDFATLITPAQQQQSLEPSVSADCPFTDTLPLAFNQGAGVLGIQGIFCNFLAAAVAAATIGLSKDLHFPKGLTFTIGL